MPVGLPTALTVGKDKETLTVPGKKYECEWAKPKTTIAMGGKDTVFVATNWVARTCRSEAWCGSSSNRAV